MVLPYRSDEEILRARLCALLDEREAERASIGAELGDLFARRAARAVSGAIAAIGGVIMLAAAVIAALHDSNPGFFGLWGHQKPDGHLSLLLGGSWLAALLAYPIARLGARRWFDGALMRQPEPSGNPRIDLVRLERSSPRRRAVRILERVEAKSLALPLAGLALIAPLALHFLLVAVAIREAASVFDGWIEFSAIFVGLAHLALAFLGARFGYRLAAMAPDEMDLKRNEGWKALGLTVAASCLPGALLFLIPPAVVFLTGLVLVPLSFGWARRAALSERFAMARVLG